MFVSVPRLAFGVALTCVFATSAGAQQCADPVIILHETNETRPSASLCQNETHTFDETIDFPQGSPCPFLINRFVVHVTEEGVQAPGLEGQPCCGLGDEGQAARCAVGLACAASVCAAGVSDSVGVPVLTHWGVVLLGLSLFLAGILRLRASRRPK